jgi:hypothetical protein
MMSFMAGKLDPTPTPLALAGLEPGDERVYRRLLRASGTSRRHISEVIGLTGPELDAVLDRFIAAGLVYLVDDEVRAEPPLQALGRVAQAETARLRDEHQVVEALRNLIPGFVLDHSASQRHGGQAEVSVQAVVTGDVVELIRALIEETTGDLLWFRPDQWRLPVSEDIDPVVREALASGRRSRALYPARALEEAPDVLRGRAEAGEVIRVVASVPSRIAVFGATVALIPDMWGESTGRRLVVREDSLVGALTALFEQMWERAMTVPGLDGGIDDPTGERRLLLVQLARGAKDEQIARALGLSLRTVRRRVADIMADLGADSRFQAGVEAVRRGWI